MAVFIVAAFSAPISAALMPLIGLRIERCLSPVKWWQMEARERVFVDFINYLLVVGAKERQRERGRQCD